MDTGHLPLTAKRFTELAGCVCLIKPESETNPLYPVSQSPVAENMPLIRARMHSGGVQLYCGLVLQGRKVTTYLPRQAKQRWCFISDIPSGKEHIVAERNNAKVWVNFWFVSLKIMEHLFLSSAIIGIFRPHNNR